MSKDTENLIVSHSLANGLTVEIIDKSRLVAGDRWYVKIICVTTGSYSSAKINELLDEEQYRAFLEKYPEGKIIFQYAKERNFVDDAVKVEVLQELVDNIADSNLDYMAKESFAMNLLDKTVEAFIEEYKVRKEMGLLEDTEEVEEPDDFSACFK